MTTRPASQQEAELISAAVARLRAGVMAIVFGMVCGMGLFSATVWLLIRGGPNVGLHLSLLRNYFPGYSVSWTGSLLGLVYGTLVGGGLGWSVAWIYNRLAALRERA